MVLVKTTTKTLMQSVAKVIAVVLKAYAGLALATGAVPKAYAELAVATAAVLKAFLEILAPTIYRGL